MRRIIFLTIAAVLLSPGLAGAALMVKEYISGSGELVTLDTNTGYHWYYDLTHFTNMTYDDQIDKIANLNLGNYGNIAGGWHMATPEEWDDLYNAYYGESVEGLFEPSYVYPSNDKTWMGRYEYYMLYFGKDAHAKVEIFHYDWLPDYYWMDDPLMPSIVYYDDYAGPELGAWVVSDHAIVPVPGALILAATGMLSAALGLKRFRRKH